MANWGAPFVAGFLVLLLVSALEFFIGNPHRANGVELDAYYFLIAGIALQTIAFVRRGKREGSKAPPAVGSSIAHVSGGWSRRTLLAAVGVLSLLLIGGIVVESPSLFPANSALGGGSGCSGAGTDGTIFLSSSVTVSIEICGQSYHIQAGQGGGLTFSYHSGRTVFLAPDSVNSSSFEYWYAVIGDSQPNKVNTTTLSLDIPAGLTSQNAVVLLFYTPLPSSPTPSTSSGSTTTGSQFFVSSSASTSSIESASSDCRGQVGSVFISTNLDETVTLNVCGERDAVTGGIGGGLVYSYRPGNLTISAPMSAPSGKTFEYWFVVLPSGTEKVETSQLSVYLPAGYSSQSVEIIAYYG